MKSELLQFKYVAPRDFWIGIQALEPQINELCCIRARLSELHCDVVSCSHAEPKSRAGQSYHELPSLDWQLKSHELPF